MEKMNAALTQLVLEQEKAGGEIRRVSLVGGYRSDRKFFEQDHWAVQRLREMVVESLEEYTQALVSQETNAELNSVEPDDVDLWGWSLLLRERDMVAPHLHKRCNVVGTYYVYSDIRDNQADAGELVISDPRVRAYAMPVENQLVTHTVQHTPGRLAIFPSYVEHYVLPFKGPGMRLSIAINVRFKRADL